VPVIACLVGKLGLGVAMPVPANVVRATLGSRRGNADDVLYARARPEKVEIAETYSVTQEISKNPRSEPGPPAGRIEMVIPYDGGEYFTRQAAGDVERAVATRGRAEARTAIIGHLLIADHRRTDLYQSMRQHGDVGVIPLEVPATSADGTTGQLTSDRQASLMSYDYAPKPPDLYPITLDVRLLDPDILDLEWDGLLDKFDVGPADLIKRLTQEARFKSELLLMIQIHLTLPVKKGQRLRPMIKRVSIGWPTVTSIATTRLAILARDPRLRPGTGRPGFTPRPVRYNPVERRLEWENVHFFQPGNRPDDQDVVNHTYPSAPMHLTIGHPGELFAAERLTVHAEVEVPGYLLSGVEARLYGATGNRGPTDPARPVPELLTRINATATLQLDDAFAKREFAPYHQIVFDEVVPDEMRITDIVTVLKMAQFDVDPPWEDPENTAGSSTPKWVLRARRPKDSLSLTIAVEAKRHSVEEHVVEEGRVGHRRTKDSGWIKLSVRGVLRRDHRELTRQMNELQAALRERYRQQQGW
jgi:hypothetical protein